MTAARTIVVVDDDPGQRQLLDNALRRAGFSVVLCEDGESGLAAAGDGVLMLLDVRLPGKSGLVLLPQLRELHPDLPILLLTAYIDIRDAVNAMKLGAIDYLEKPDDLDELLSAVDDALGESDVPSGRGDAVALPDGVVAAGTTMQGLFADAARAATTDATVLIQGDSGTGKQVLADFIQENSHRASAPYLTINCGALPEHLIESELFGHERGAFTGADGQRAGRFEAAAGGTLFLDEIGELPLALQPVLLRVLESGAFQRVGGTEDRHADVRIIAASNRDLGAEVAAGRFRDDLFYRLSVFPLVVPPLTARPEDIIPLANQMLVPYRKCLSPATGRSLRAYPWPGNVRELRNTMERASILAEGRQILDAHLPEAIRRGTESAPHPDGIRIGTMADIQRQAILEALEKTNGNKTRAAELLGISRRNFVYKLREYGM